MADKPQNDVKGAVKEKLGLVTGDRHLEAEGRAERQAHQAGHEPNREDLEQAEHQVRRQHRDIP